MRILLKQVKVLDKNSPHHQEKVSILIENGVITKIGKSIRITKNVKTVECKGALVSIGWLDIGTQIGEPGYEHRETLSTVAAAAARGGFTEIACFPNTQPPIHTKSEVQYIKNNTKDSIVNFHPIGAISTDCRGEEMSDMVDLHHAGAVAFSDGMHSVQNNGVLMRALEYVKSFNGLIINHPHDKAIARNGMVHEGPVSTALGTPGIADMAESIQVERDLSLRNYTDSKIFIHNISSHDSVEKIRAAKAINKKHIYSSVPYLNLIYNDTALEQFDANYKVLPPLRTEEDRLALIDGVKDGIIDCITTNHKPVEIESKNLEFSRSAYGAIGLETCYAVINTHLKKALTTRQIVQALAYKTRESLGLSIPTIAIDQPANLTIFDPEHAWTYDKKSIRSKSSNTPFIGEHFVGKVLAVVNNKKIQQF